MLNVTFADLIAAKQVSDAKRMERIERTMSESAKLLADGVRVMRAKRIEEMNAAIAAEKEAEKVRLAAEKERNARKLKSRIRYERDRLIRFVIENTTTATRKDGSRYMRARPGKADEVKQAQARAMQLNVTSVRPEHGYPAPPPRRSEAYPQGGLWGKPSNVPDIDVKRGERNRLAEYCETCYNAERGCMQVSDGEVGKVVSLQGESLGGITLEGKTFVACPSNSNEPVTTHKTYTEALAFVAISPRVRRMMAQLQRLDSQIKYLGSESHVRKVGRHSYAAINDSRETLSR